MPDAASNATLSLGVSDLGVMGYAQAYGRQLEAHGRVLAARERGGLAGELLLVEHPPVVTITRRPGAAEHLVATPESLAAAGVELAQTDRGGDVTYHGPGQLVAYPIVDLNRLGIRLHEYLRALEGAVIDVCAGLGLVTERDECATGVWVPVREGSPHTQPAKICAVGVRVRKWVTLHGVGFNVTTNLEHFKLIVPCGLTGRPVTSLEAELGDACPAMDAVKASFAEALESQLAARSRSKTG